jgi:hypothetical protein
LYWDSGKPLTPQDKIASAASTSLAMLLEQDHQAKQGGKHQVEKEFEARLLILGEFDTVNRYGRYGMKSVELTGRDVTGTSVWKDFRTNSRFETKLSFQDEPRT